MGDVRQTGDHPVEGFPRVPQARPGTPSTPSIDRGTRGSLMVVMVAVPMWMPVMRGSTEEVLVLRQLGDTGPGVLCRGSHVLKRRKLIKWRLIAFMSRKKSNLHCPLG